jgi:hypothetical protein
MDTVGFLRYVVGFADSRGVSKYPLVFAISLDFSNNRMVLKIIFGVADKA